MRWFCCAKQEDIFPTTKQVAGVSATRAKCPGYGTSKMINALAVVPIGKQEITLTALSNFKKVQWRSMIGCAKTTVLIPNLHTFCPNTYIAYQCSHTFVSLGPMGRIYAQKNVISPHIGMKKIPSEKKQCVLL